MRRAGVLLLAISMCTCTSLRHASIYPLPGNYAYSIPKEIDDGLVTTSIEASLFDTVQMAKLTAFFDMLKKGAFGEIHGVLLLHEGRLVLEEYFPGYRFHGGLTDFSAEKTHHLASVTKSLTSLCVGIAIDRGLIKGLDQPFLDFYEKSEVPDREEKTGIAIRHLLTMTDGLKWDESSHPYTDLRNDVVRLHMSPDPLAFILRLKPVAAPGARWRYNGACPNLLGDIVLRASGMPLDRFADEHLFRPLGIAGADWVTLSKGFIYASGDAELKPRDMAKIGQLVLNRGVWEGKRVVSEEWIDASLRPAAKADASTEYGFMWWLPVLPGSIEQSLGPVYQASGWGDQHIIVVPKRSLVLVLTGGNYLDPEPGTLPILQYMLKELFS